MYIGSFNADKPIRSDLNPAGLELFEKEQADLLQDLFDIPQRACDRKASPLKFQHPYDCLFWCHMDWGKAQPRLCTLHAQD